MYAEQEPTAIDVRLPPNPRRVTAEASVSLKKRPGPLPPVADQPGLGGVSSPSKVSAAHDERRPLPPSNRLHETYSPDEWFDDSNKNATGRTNVRVIDGQSCYSPARLVADLRR